MAIDTREFDLPAQVEFGMAWSQSALEQFTTSLGTSFEYNNFASNRFKTGLEIAYRDMLFLRAGYVFEDERSTTGGDDNIFGPAFGAGFKLPGAMHLTIDYAYRTVDFFDDNQAFSIIIGF